MTVFVHNTLSRRKERFEPLDPSNVRMYVCGPTVYDRAHIGNARPVVVFDVLYRLLKRKYPKVTYVRNITDVDDKIITAARENNEPIDALTRRTTDAFHADMAALGTLQPDIEPRATGHIPQMIDMIETLLAKGNAYVADGHVLFNVPSMKDYGRLSGRDREEQIAGARVEVAPYKKDPADFILWKPSAADQPGWDSPWGRGRPGWHIECSAMSEAHLGESFDIHGGGQDLIFPHHENEIAQSVCAHDGRPFAKYWMHNGFVMVNGEKMSKSLGNFFTVRDLLAAAPGEAIRLALLQTHYRQPLDFTKDGLGQARTVLDRLYGALRQTEAAKPAQVPAAIDAALEDDLNTPQALAVLHDLVNQLNKASSPAAKSELRGQVMAAGAALGLLQQESESWFTAGEGGLDEASIAKLIADRNDARKQRNYAEADRIRKYLADHGVVLEDGAGGTQWKRAS
ncbi:MAG: cysteine--tRNA ligase [Alphaproteobacteria bacterium]